MHDLILALSISIYSLNLEDRYQCWTSLSKCHRDSSGPVLLQEEKEES